MITLNRKLNAQSIQYVWRTIETIYKDRRQTLSTQRKRRGFQCEVLTVEVKNCWREERSNQLFTSGSHPRHGCCPWSRGSRTTDALRNGSSDRRVCGIPGVWRSRVQSGWKSRRSEVSVPSLWGSKVKCFTETEGHDELCFWWREGIQISIKCCFYLM